MKKRQFIKDLKKDDVVSDIFAVKFKKPVEPYKNGYRFELRLSDSSKEIMYKYWGPHDESSVKDLYDSIGQGDVVYVTGRVNEWNDNLEISANDKDTIKVVDEYDVGDFIKKTDKSIDDMWNKLIGYVDMIRDDDIKKVVEYFFRDESFSEKFKKWPAAMYIHHGWLGGLLEHTLSVVEMLKGFHNVHSDLNLDLMLAGGLLHDIGKLREFEIKTTINVTEEGMLIGHVTIGVEMLKEAFDRLDTPFQLREKLIHMIITHMGEYGSNKTPSFPEALALFHADQTDGALMQMKTLKSEANTEDDFIYSRHLGNIFLR